MNDPDADLEQFVAILPKLLADHSTAGQPLDHPATLPGLRMALEESDVSNLALETADMSDSLRWLTATVSEIAHTSPSLAFVLASRYTAQRALTAGGAIPSPEIAAGAVTPPKLHSNETTQAPPVVVPLLFEPELLLLIDTANLGAIVAEATEVADAETQPPRTGLADARVRQVLMTESPVATLDSAAATTAINEWTVLMSAVSLGIAESARNAAEKYAADRRQFGSSLVSFPALRAMLAEMQLRVAAVRTLLDQALSADATTAATSQLWATAGRAAVDIALDAIQVHGGYGYIDEYPVAGLLRDAVSMRARGGPRRYAVAAIATDRLGALS